ENTSNFGYEVDDSRANDFHNHRQIDDGVAATGSYSWRDERGNLNTVDYVADHKTGFRASVRNEKGRTEWGFTNDDEDANSDYQNQNKSGYEKLSSPPQQYPNTDVYGNQPETTPLKEQYPSERSFNKDYYRNFNRQSRFGPSIKHITL
uniref:Uncharacterized protein n=1 Tax=Strigamia maritima TaxID=126957 RepID=T1IUJ7_STRMM